MNFFPNTKVHFALSNNNQRDLSVLKMADVKYALFTAYPYICKKRNEYKFSLSETKAGFSHIIVDSGLFTLMFGSKSSEEYSAEYLREWMHRLVRFVKGSGLQEAAVVECDCQKLAGVGLAWELREEMRELLPCQEIINVYHLEDGADGFDRLVKFSDYLAISVPELRFSAGIDHVRMANVLARRAKKIKPAIKIHLLGCTEKKMLKQNKFIATSADSSSWQSSLRFGYVNGTHCNHITQKACDDVWDLYSETCKQLGFPKPNKTPPLQRNAATLFLETKICKDNYENWAGSQD